MAKLKNLQSYKNLIFDCDGIILNSNKIKTEAFKEVVYHYGNEAAEELAQFHIMNGGISRYEKFNYFFETISSNHNLDKNCINVEQLLENYGSIVREKLESCEISIEIMEYRKYSDGVWYVVSGSDQNELINIFKKKQLHKSFNGGIYGSPLSKDEIFKNIFKDKIDEISNSIYIGDSRYDYLSAKKIGMDFVFLSRWSEFRDIENYAKNNNVFCFKDFKDIIDCQI
ncbi:HAD family hydrolase [uncultured Prochlorococcus sp.]|uniref:HAD family hydrolase n=1 Tax=uncultured Prochlorococcus sp. TaxID=159733 RepID=UPI00258C4789|nr:HAD hydrolase-like protein [uncultured Prochlorococcus sp.]